MSAAAPARPRGPLEYAIASLLLLAGVWITLVVGRRGLDAYDASIVFDGGWRVLLGMVPVRDFLAPYGVPVFAMQALLFRLFGVTWFALVMHGAITNGLFGALAFALLRLEGASRPAAALFAALSLVVCGPPFGVGHAEQDAFLLSLAALVAAHAAVRRSAPLFWALVPPLAALAFLCKPIPTLLVLPALAYPLLEARPDGRAAARRPLVLSSAGVALAAAAAVLLLEIPLDRLRLCFVTLALGTGGERARHLWDASQALVPGIAMAPAHELAAALPAAAAVLLRAVARWSWPYRVFLLAGALPFAPLLSRLLPPLPRAAGAAAAAAAALALAVPQAGFVLLPLAALALLAAPLLRSRALSAEARGGLFGLAALAAGYLYFRTWTPLSGAALEALGVAALLAPSVGRLAPSNLLRGATASWLLAATLAFSQLTNQEPESGAALLFVAAGLAFCAIEANGRAPVLLLLAAVSTWDAARFHHDVNLPRKVLGREPFVADPRSAELPPPLAYLVVQKGGDPDAADIAGLSSFLRARPEDFLLVGESGFFYGVIGRRPADPALWIHPGLASPRPGTRDFDAYSAELRVALRRERVRWVVVQEGDKSRDRLDSLPWLREAIGAAPARTIGVFRVFDAESRFLRPG